MQQSDTHAAAETAEPERPRSRRRWPRRLAFGLLSTVLVIVLLATAVGVWSVRRAFPQHDGQAALAALDAPVEVLRDEFGVPTIYGSTSLDLFRAQGYVHAQDRFWQMDAWRHISTGRTAEMFGASQLGTDRFLRTLGWERIAEAEYDLLDPDSRGILDAYADGVNAYLDSRGHRALGFEYSVLGLQNGDYRPEPWKPVHTLAFLKLMAWDLRGNMDAEIERAVLLKHLPAERVEELFPPYPDGAPVIVGETSARTADRALAESLGDVDLERLLGGTADGIAAVEALTGPLSEGLGSNSWVIAGEHTATGAPLLANDPHLSIQMPSIWYETALRCTERTADCVDDVAGFSFAGVPGVVIGFNDRIGWGFTNLGPDVMDLYIERINPDNPHQYEYQGEWVDMEVATETLTAAGGQTETMEIRSTRHGPIISDTYGALDDYDADAAAGADGDGETVPEYAVALRWTALDPGQTFRALPGMNRAQSWEEFREAARFFEVPSQNLVYADVEGNIGYQAPGRIPIRSAGDGLLPAPGWTGEQEWTGYIDYDDLPWVLNPDRGWIVTANNAVVDGDYPHMLSSSWDAGYRARRIEELVGDSLGGVTVEQVQDQQMDNHDGSAEWLVPALLAVGADEAGDGTGPIAEMQQVLAGWDLQADADSAGAAAYAATWSKLLAATFQPELPEGYWPGGNARWFEVVRRLLDEPDNAWWEDPDEPGRQASEDMLRRALTEAHAELAERLGDDPDGWRWGDLHTATFRNGTLGESGIGPIEDRFNRGPYPAGGGSGIVNATGWNAAQGYEVAALPSMRMVLDLGDLDRSTTIHTTGQSGHAYHPNYTDMVPMWQEGAARRALWSRSAVEAAATDRLELHP